MDKNKVSIYNLMLRGWITVFIPVTLIMIVTLIFLYNFINLNYIISVIISISLAWYYWRFSIKKWIVWAHQNEIATDRIYKIGKRSLLLWKKDTVLDALINEEEE